MRENTEYEKKKKRGAWICAGIVVAFVLLYFGMTLLPLINDSFGDGLAIGFLLLYGLIIAVIVAGVLLALHMRLKEIEGGEEEDAKKY